MDGAVARVAEKNVLSAGEHEIKTKDEIGYNVMLLAPQLDLYLTLFAKRILSKLKISHLAGQIFKNWYDMHFTDLVVP